MANCTVVSKVDPRLRQDFACYRNRVLHVLLPFRHRQMTKLARDCDFDIEWFVLRAETTLENEPDYDRISCNDYYGHREQEPSTASHLHHMGAE